MVPPPRRACRSRWGKDHVVGVLVVQGAEVALHRLRSGGIELDDDPAVLVGVDQSFRVGLLGVDAVLRWHRSGRPRSADSPRTRPAGQCRCCPLRCSRRACSPRPARPPLQVADLLRRHRALGNSSELASCGPPSGPLSPFPPPRTTTASATITPTTRMPRPRTRRAACVARRTVPGARARGRSARQALLLLPPAGHRARSLEGGLGIGGGARPDRRAAPGPRIPASSTRR